MPKRIAVHRHPVKWRKLAIRREGLSQHSTMCTRQWTILNWKERDGLQHLFFGFGDGKHGRTI